MSQHLAEWTVEGQILDRRPVMTRMVDQRCWRLAHNVVDMSLRHVGLEAEGKQQQRGDQPRQGAPVRSSRRYCGCCHKLVAGATPNCYGRE